ncbi:MAG: hypothetical protein LBD24_05360 [Spirochaetaceae bacterium]|jgi:hypothetical protein|nr:hypothetical protein [Spirochaetaceae bacterium]
MAKTSDGERSQYVEKIKVHKASIDRILKWEKQILQEIQQEPESAVIKRLTLVDGMLNLTSYHIILNTISQSVLKKNNEDALGEARKSINKALSYFEDLVSGYVDAPFSDYDERVSALDGVNSAERYRLVRKLGLTIQLFENSFRDNSKWKWTFVEAEGRFAAVTKNILDLKNINANTDPRSINYEPTVYHLRLVKKLLNDAADRYRERYELSTNHINDFQASLNFMNALRRLHIILGESYEAETIKKKLDVWEVKLQSDLNRKQEEKNTPE